MPYRRWPTEAAWKRHTRRARQCGLSAAALACLGIQPHVTRDPNSYTGYTGTVRVLNRDEATRAGKLIIAAIGAGRGAHAKQTGITWTVYVPVSEQAAHDLAHAKKIPNIPSPGHGERTAAYNAIMRPTARARQRADRILQED